MILIEKSKEGLDFTAKRGKIMACENLLSPAPGREGGKQNLIKKG